MRTVVRNSYTPQTGDYCNKIVIDEDKSVQYIFDSDGVFSVYTSKQQEGAPMFYVDSTVNAAKNELKTYADTKDRAILAEAKAYTDGHSGEGGVSQQYVDQHDAATLSSAKSYTDSVGEATLASANTAISTAITQANVPVITLSNTDIAEGSTLPANNFYGVYIEGSE